MGFPKIRKLNVLLRKCAAMESPYGPAPMMAMSVVERLKVVPQREKCCLRRWEGGWDHARELLLFLVSSQAEKI
jgi:hypothetical protein